MDSFILNDPSNNILVDINSDSDSTKSLLQPNTLNSNFTDNNASNSNEEIFVEIDSFFLDSKKVYSHKILPMIITLKITFLRAIQTKK